MVSMSRPKDTRTRQERFDQSYLVADSGCWEWSRNRTKKGYGSFYHDYSKTGAHRVAWELYNGPIPEGMMVRHKCDNPPCVNPEHLELGTMADNARDAVIRRRTLVGERNTSSVLTADQVVTIRARYASGDSTRDIANDYPITISTVQYIVNRKSWKHI